MSTISAAAVNELRKRTDQPLMDCKKALNEAEGDMEKAVELLRKWNAKATVKREGNETAEGRVVVVIDKATATAVILELRCESAPTAKNEHFEKLATELAEHIRQHNPADVATLLAQPFGNATVKDRIDETVGLIREKMIVHRFARLSGGTFGSYIHHDGSLGALLHCTGSGGNDEMLRDICAHIAALNPQYTLVSDVPADVLEKEKAFSLQQIKDDPKNANKPANIIEKIAEGKLKTWLAECVLLEQPMANAAKYPGQTVGQVLTKMGLTVGKALRYKVGSLGA